MGYSTTFRLSTGEDINVLADDQGVEVTGPISFEPNYMLLTREDVIEMFMTISNALRGHEQQKMRISGWRPFCQMSESDLEGDNGN